MSKIGHLHENVRFLGGLSPLCGDLGHCSIEYGKGGSSSLCRRRILLYYASRIISGNVTVKYYTFFQFNR